MKFTHRTAGPRKGSGTSPVVRVKAEPKPKRQIAMCRECDEPRIKCGCAQKPFVKLGDFLR